MIFRLPRMALLGSLALAGVLLAGCAGQAQRAPVEDRTQARRLPAKPMPAASAPAPAASAPMTAEESAKVLPGAENAGKAGYYTVKPGDTLARIALENGQNWRDVALWNNIDNVNLIEVGQVLRVVAPGVDPGLAVARPVAPAGKVETRPLDARAAAASAAASSASAPATATPAAAAASSAREGDDDVNWLWPAAGPVVAGFDEGRNVKGLAITGKAGDPVLAAADGRVVYAGSGLRGYGNLVIVKHNSTYLTAYAHNQTLLVKEDQVVRRGQKIAEMGSSDADRVQLHFEIRRLGKPIDPAKLLPPR